MDKGGGGGEGEGITQIVSCTGAKCAALHLPNNVGNTAAPIHTQNL